jgi:hypothetical protein
MNERGQTPVGGLPMTAAVALVVFSAIDAVQTAPVNAHIIDERAALQWIILTLAGSVLFFLRRLLKRQDDCIHDIHVLKQDVAIINRVCGIRHTERNPRTLPNLDRED